MSEIGGGTPLVGSRKEYHGSISPAVYSHHAREHIVADIQNLGFPEGSLIDPLDLAHSVAEDLEYSDGQAKEAAKKDGTLELIEPGRDPNLNVFYYGYADRHFTALFAGG